MTGTLFIYIHLDICSV